MENIIRLLFDVTANDGNNVIAIVMWCVILGLIILVKWENSWSCSLGSWCESNVKN